MGVILFITGPTVLTASCHVICLAPRGLDKPPVIWMQRVKAGISVQEVRSQCSKHVKTSFKRHYVCVCGIYLCLLPSVVNWSISFPNWNVVNYKQSAGKSLKSGGHISSETTRWQWTNARLSGGKCDSYTAGSANGKQSHEKFHSQAVKNIP